MAGAFPNILAIIATQRGYPAQFQSYNLDSFWF